MVCINDLAIEGNASVLMEGPRYGVHIDHNLDTMGRTRFSRLDVNYRAGTIPPRNQVGLATECRRFSSKPRIHRRRASG